MNPIGSANKYLQESISEYGLDDYTTALENEEQLDEEFGFDWAELAEKAANIGTKVQGFYTEHKEKIDTGMKVVGHIQKATKTTEKGRERSSRGKKRQVSAQQSSEISSSERKEEMARGKMEQIKGELQMSLGEMRRQMGVSGISDPDVQLEVIRNSFVKQYFAMDGSNKLAKVLLKQTVQKMDQQLFQAFQARNMKRAGQGLPALIASYQQPTMEYKV